MNELKGAVSPKRQIKSYRDLDVWQKAMDLIEVTYRLTKLLPKEETFGLAIQMQRAAVSVAANIAEGHGREHLGDYLRHLSFARGSLMELETLVFAGQRVHRLPEGEIRSLLEMSDRVGRMLAGLQKSLRALDARK